MNDLQPLMNRGLEPVMKACQGQHLSIPAGGKTQVYLNKFKAEEKVEFHLLADIFKRTTTTARVFTCSFMNCHESRTDNQLERKKLPKAFEDFQGHEELKDGLSHRLCQSGALLLQSAAHPLHRHVHIIGYLEDERM